MTTEKKPTFIITVTRPVLTEEERAKRMKAIEKAAVELVLDTERIKERRKRNEHYYD